jgi:hypothetical protein
MAKVVRFHELGDRGVEFVFDAVAGSAIRELAAVTAVTVRRGGPR